MAICAQATVLSLARRESQVITPTRSSHSIARLRRYVGGCGSRSGESAGQAIAATALMYRPPVITAMCATTGPRRSAVLNPFTWIRMIQNSIQRRRLARASRRKSQRLGRRRSSRIRRHCHLCTSDQGEVAISARTHTSQCTDTPSARVLARRSIWEQLRWEDCAPERQRCDFLRKFEAPPGFEPGVEVCSAFTGPFDDSRLSPNPMNRQFCWISWLMPRPRAFGIVRSDSPFSDDLRSKRRIATLGRGTTRQCACTRGRHRRDLRSEWAVVQLLL